MFHPLRLLIPGLLVSSAAAGEVPNPPEGDYVAAAYVQRLGCIEAPTEICSIEQESFSHRLIIRGSWALLTEPDGSGAGGPYLMHFDTYENGRWMGRRAWCDYQYCPEGLPSPAALDKLQAKLKFEPEPVYLWGDKSVLSVRWMEPAWNEWPKGYKPQVLFDRYIQRSTFDAQLSQLRQLHAPRECRKGPAIHRLTPYVPKGKPCLPPAGP